MTGAEPGVAGVNPDSHPAGEGQIGGDQTGRRILITGANTGLGLASATALAARGAQVVMAVRDLERGRAAAAAVQEQVPGARPELARLDLASLSSVHEFAAEQADRGDVDVLINNAGVSMTPERTLTENGFELQMGTNFVGHFVLTALLLPSLQRTGNGRVVSLSSMAAWLPRAIDGDLGEDGPYRREIAYSKSKLACGIFGIELDRRLKEAGTAVTSVVAHPGWVRTELFGRSADRLTGMIHWFTGRLAAPVTAGARSQVYAATAPELTGGEFIGPRAVSHGQPGVLRPPRLMTDAQVAAELWRITEERTGVRFHLDVTD